MPLRTHRTPASVVLLALLFAAPAVGAQEVKRAAVSRTMLGDAALVINARTDGRIEVGAAGEQRTVELKFPWGPVATWADSANKVLRGRARPRRGDTLTWRAELEQPGRGGGLILTRRASGSQSTYSIFFADSSFGGFGVPVTIEEATILVNTMRRAVVRARELSAPPKASGAAAGGGDAKDSAAGKAPAPRQPPARRPAAKQPPAKDPAPNDPAAIR